MALPAITQANRVPLFPNPQSVPPQWQAPVLLDVDVREQLRRYWCWAAVASAIEVAYGEAFRTQCEIASDVLEMTCCPDGQGDCNKPWQLGPALGKHDRGECNVDDPKKPAFVMAEIDAGAPIALRVEGPDRGGHFVVVSGYLLWSGGLDVCVCDPWWGLRSLWRIERLITAYEHSDRWTMTICTKGNRRVPRV